MTRFCSISPFILGVLILAGCSSQPQTQPKTEAETDTGRYELKDDVAPNTPISVEHIEDVHPRYEPYSLGGNSDYTLRGKHYKIVRDPRGFKQSGQASWYGEKFQGHLTSNGEVYDMYSMTAAHKTLPLPSYVKVLNKDNGKTAIVRVNDRGPFHEGRIIDLSYAAAKKLGVIKTGTANVEIEVIIVEKPNNAEQMKGHPRYVIQTASSPHKDRLASLGQELAKTLQVDSFVESKETQHRLMLGPFTDQMLTQDVLEQVKVLGYSGAFIKSHPSVR